MWSGKISTNGWKRIEECNNHGSRMMDGKPIKLQATTNLQEVEVQEDLGNVKATVYTLYQNAGSKKEHAVSLVEN